MSGPRVQSGPVPVRKKNWLRNALIGLLVMAAVLIGYSSTTRVEGIEFEPHTWQVRTFSFRADPLTQWQWTSIRHDLTKWPVAPAITAHLDKQLAAMPIRWDLGGITILGSRQSGPARSTLQLLTLYGFSGTSKPRDFLLDWTSRHPKRAAEFWPAIQQLTILGAYAEVPATMELCLGELDDAQFSQSLKKAMARALYQRATNLSSTGENREAVSVAEVGLTYDPDFIPLQKLIDPIADLPSSDQSHDE